MVKNSPATQETLTPKGTRKKITKPKISRRKEITAPARNK